MILALLAFIVVAGVIILVHEVGHFLATRLTGMRVERFSIGFPPRLVSKKIGQTEFVLSWIPLGGYVKIAGMVDESLDKDAITGAPDEFMSKNPLQKTFVLSAGVLMNYLIALLIMAGLTLAVGIAEVGEPVIGQVTKDMPAEAAGLQGGDRILQVGDKRVAEWRDLVGLISTASDTVHLTVTRRDSVWQAAVPTTVRKEGDTTRRVIGIVAEVSFRKASLIESFGQGIYFCYGTTAGILDFFRQLVLGQASIRDLAGPVGVAKLSGESARQGLGTFLFFLAFVSISIGFLNILPFPVLDGGHIVYVLIEAILRRPISTKVKLAIQQIGFVLLLLLVLVVSYHDIMRLFHP
ncbi:MAG: RIP metalloprotease RseP [bacterium]